MAAKADQPGLVRMQRQFELAHSFLEIVKERLCLVLMLKADDNVVRIADDDHVARRLGEGTKTEALTAGTYRAEFPLRTAHELEIAPDRVRDESAPSRPARRW